MGKKCHPAVSFDDFKERGIVVGNDGVGKFSGNPDQVRGDVVLQFRLCERRSRAAIHSGDNRTGLLRYARNDENGGGHPGAMLRSASKDEKGGAGCSHQIRSP